MKSKNKERIGIAMYTPSADGGHARYTQEIMNALADIPVENFDFCLVTSKDINENFDSSRYCIHRILPKLKHKNDYASYFGWAISRVLHYICRELILCWWLMRNSHIGLVHFQEVSTWIGGGCILFIKNILRRKVTMTVHNIKPHRYPKIIPSSVVDLLNKIIYLQCDRLFVHSNSLRDDLHKITGVNSEKIFIAHHGVWTSNAEISKNKCTVKKDTVLFFGNIRRNKGLHYLLKSMPLLKNSKKLLIAGFPFEKDYFENEVLPLIEIIRNKNFQIDLLDHFIDDDKVASIFKNAAVIVLPYENFSAQSGVLFDAITYAVPVVTTSAGALGETVKYLNIGETVLNIEPDILAAAIDLVIDNENNDFYKNNFLKAKTTYSWNQHAEVLFSVYKCLIK